VATATFAAISIVVLAGDGFGFKCANKDCGFKTTVVFGGGMMFEQATGWCHTCGKLRAVQWTRPGAPRLDPNAKAVPKPQPLAEVWNPASGAVHKIYKCPGCGGGFMEIRKPAELSHCPKCSKPGFKVDPDAPRLAVD
jgi:hypothetical protein